MLVLFLFRRDVSGCISNFVLLNMPLQVFLASCLALNLLAGFFILYLFAANTCCCYRRKMVKQRFLKKKSHLINLIHKRYQTNPLKLQVEGIILLRMLRAKRRIIYLVDLDPVRFVLSIQSESLEPVLVTVVSTFDHNF